MCSSCPDPRLPRPRRFKALLSFWPLTLSGLVVLLAVLAFLQYRWTNEATAASEMRIGAEIESLMLKWHGDLYGEFSAICAAMQVGPDSGARDTWNNYLERYVEWNNAPPHESFPNVYRNPDLVQDVYIWDTNLDSKPQLFSLNADKKKIEAVEIPENLQILLAPPARELQQPVHILARLATTPARRALFIRRFVGSTVARSQQYGLAIR